MTITAGQTRPGLHAGVSLESYLRWPILSQTVLKEGRASMAHLHAAELEERSKIPTDAMLLGSALHVCFLEPEQMPGRVVLWEGPRRAGAEWKAFLAEHGAKVILTAGMYENLVGMVQSLRRAKFVRAWSGRIQDVEVAAVGEVCGIEMKGRCDALTEDPLVDLKKVRSADPRAITRAAIDYGYHVQAWVYLQLFQRDRFVLVCVEDQPPYDVVPYELSPAFVRAGESIGRRLLAQYKECQASGVWPGRGDEVVTLEPPEWISDEPAHVSADTESVVMLGGVDPFETGEAA